MACNKSLFNKTNRTAFPIVLAFTAIFGSASIVIIDGSMLFGLLSHTSSTIKSYSIPKGTLTWSIDNVFLNDVPDKVYVALTSAEAFSGHIQKNPFNFQHMNVRLIGFDVNGRSQPSVPFTPHYEDSNYIEPYLSLYNATGRYQKDIV